MRKENKQEVGPLVIKGREIDFINNPPDDILKSFRTNLWTGVTHFDNVWSKSWGFWRDGQVIKYFDTKEEVVKELEEKLERFL